MGSTYFLVLSTLLFCTGVDTVFDVCRKLHIVLWPFSSHNAFDHTCTTQLKAAAHDTPAMFSMTTSVPQRLSCGSQSFVVCCGVLYHLRAIFFC